MKKTHLIAVGLAVAFLAAFLFFPLGYSLRKAVFAPEGFTLYYFRNLYGDVILRQSIVNSLLIATSVTALTGVVALPLAFVMVRYRFRGKGVLASLLLLPMIMPPFVGAIGMKRVFAQFGVVQVLLSRLGLIAESTPLDWFGKHPFWVVVAMEVLHLYPIMYLNCSASLANVDPSLEEAAINLGSRGLRLFRRITLPMMMPGLFAGSIIVFIWAFTDLGTPLIFSYDEVVPVRIYDRARSTVTDPSGHALVVVVLAMTVVLYLLSKRLFGSRGYQSLSRGSARGNEKPLGGLGAAAATAFVLAMVAVACIPHAAVVLASLSDGREWSGTLLPRSYTLAHLKTALAEPLTASGMRNSLLLSICSTGVDLFLGVLIAYILVRHRFRGSSLLDGAVMLPLAIPGVVLAFGYVAAFSRMPPGPDDWAIVSTFKNWWNAAIVPRENPLFLLVIAYAVRRLPYMVRAAYAGFQQVDVQFEEAAVNLGSPPLRAARRITIPLVAANLIGGAILVFSFAMLEVSDSLILAMKDKFYPITKVIYDLSRRADHGISVASALGVFAMVFLALSLLVAGRALGRRMGQLFRA